MPSKEGLPKEIVKSSLGKRFAILHRQLSDFSGSGDKGSKRLDVEVID